MWIRLNRRRRIDWRRVWPLLVLAALAPLNVQALLILADSRQVGVAPDFQQYADALERLLAGEPLYGPDWLWRYSPVALVTLGPAIATGLIGWSLLHLAALLFVRPWYLAALVALSWPFWVDVISGNTLTFAAVAGIAAMRGSRFGAYTFWWLVLIIPRPVQLPLAAYLAWTRPELRRGLAVLTVVNMAMLVVIGQGVEWVRYLAERGTEDSEAVFNLHPAGEMGVAWLLIGLPLAAILSWRGFPGQAGVVLWPSVLAQYLLLAFVPPGAPMHVPQFPVKRNR